MSQESMVHQVALSLRRVQDQAMPGVFSGSPKGDSEGRGVAVGPFPCRREGVGSTDPPRQPGWSSEGARGSQSHPLALCFAFSQFLLSMPWLVQGKITIE